MKSDDFIAEYEKNGYDGVFALIAPLFKAYERFGVWTSVGLAQVVQESKVSDGWSKLLRNQNNLHGIKDPVGALLPTSEYMDGVKTDMTSRFGVYATIEEGIQAYCELMCADIYEQIRTAQSVLSACAYLSSSPYSTTPSYGRYVLSIIEKHDLTKFDGPRGSFRTLRYRDRGEDVETVQDMLIRLGYETSITGIFTGEMFEIVKDYQGSRKLLADGVVGIRTYTALLVDSVMGDFLPGKEDTKEFIPISDHKPIETVGSSYTPRFVADYNRTMFEESEE